MVSRILFIQNIYSPCQAIVYIDNVKSLLRGLTVSTFLKDAKYLASGKLAKLV